MLGQGVLAWSNGMEHRLFEIIALGRGGHHRSFEAGAGVDEEAHLIKISKSEKIGKFGNTAAAALPFK